MEPRIVYFIQTCDLYRVIEVDNQGDYWVFQENYRKDIVYFSEEYSYYKKKWNIKMDIVACIHSRDIRNEFITEIRTTKLTKLLHKDLYDIQINYNNDGSISLA